MTRPRAKCQLPGCSRGFTLLELSVVLALLGAILVMAVPRLSIFEDAAFRSDARKLAALIRQLDDKAAADKSFYRLIFTMGASSLEAQRSINGDSWTAPEGLPSMVRLGRSASIAAIEILGARKESGEAEVVFDSSGAEPFTISLASGELRCTISYNPYSGRVSVS